MTMYTGRELEWRLRCDYCGTSRHFPGIDIHHVNRSAVRLGWVVVETMKHYCKAECQTAHKEADIVAE